ncbi:MAG: response regulator transcription factor [Aquisalimonadaceae bacterium]
MYKVLTVGFREHLRSTLDRLIPNESSHLAIEEISDLDQAVQLLDKGREYHLLIACLYSNDLRGIANVQKLREQRPDLPMLALFDIGTDRAGAIWAVRGLLGGLKVRQPLYQEAERPSPLIGQRSEVPARPYNPPARYEGEPDEEQENFRLTPRQVEVLFLLKEGKSNKEIARRLDLSEGTVKVHCMAIFRELGVTNRTQAAMAASKIAQARPELERPLRTV